MEVSKAQKQTELQRWLHTVEALKECPDWERDEQPVAIISTHISVVFLGQHHVLKLKKPVDLGFLDYTTIEKRRDACLAEVELNRRLCTDIYLGVQPISLIDGRLRFSDEGPIVEYGVLMKRLPSELMLDQLVARGEVTEAIIERVAERLSDFHQQANRGPDVERFGSPEVVASNWRENFDQTAPYIGRTIAASAYESIREWVRRWIGEHLGLLHKRVLEERVCEGHGDVRAESICVTNGLCIYDCIEFNERFRFGDVASEAAFLAMDLDARGRPDLGYYFSEQYGLRQNDPDINKLLPFYRCYRAYVRGKVQSFRLDEAELTALDREVVSLRARRYFDLARRYASPLSKRTVIVVTGLSGTGKTSVARAVAGELGLRVVSSDAIRKSLFRIDAETEYGAGPYGDAANRSTYQTMMRRGRELLEQDGAVVLDATFRRRADRAHADLMAVESGAQLRFVECVLEPKQIRERLDRRAERKEGRSDANWSTYLRQVSEFEPFHESEGRRLELDTARDLGVTTHFATDWLRHNDR